MIYGNGGYSLDDLGEMVSDAYEDLKSKKKKFDAIAVSGMSGVVVGAPLALKLKKPLLIVRKRTDSSHHGLGEIIGHKHLNSDTKVLWLDDFVASGNTGKYVVGRIEAEGAELVGQYLYQVKDSSKFMGNPLVFYADAESYDLNGGERSFLVNIGKLPEVV